MTLPMMMLLKNVRLGWVCALLLTGAALAVQSPLLAQQAAPPASGSGVIVEANPDGAYGLFPLDPMACTTPGCARLRDLLYPRLLAVDPLTRTIVPTEAGSAALAANWEVLEDGSGVVIVSLREDLFWSDGTPITAYDVFFTFWNALLTAQVGRLADPLGYGLSGVRGAVPLDDHTLALIYANSGCEALEYANRHILPAHVYAPEFSAVARDYFDMPVAARDTSTLAGMYDAWKQDFDAHQFRAHPLTSIEANALVTAGRFALDEIRPNDFARFHVPGGALAYNWIDLPDSSRDTPVSLFLTGVTNLIMNPPLDRWDDIRAVPNAQTAAYPGLEWDSLVLNLADPRLPRSNQDDQGNVLDQGHHPIFGDVRVRQALQLAINVDALIETALLGEGTPLGGTIIPASWAYEAARLDPVAYDPNAAERLLEAAGWKDVNRDGVRECVGCLYAEPNTALSFTLTYNSQLARSNIGMTLIARQLRRVGIALSPDPSDADSLAWRARSQTFDVLLVNRRESFPVASDQSSWFTAATDRLGGSVFSLWLDWNAGSYRNAEVEALFEQAKNVRDCATDERAAIYAQVQALLRADVPIIPLYVPHEFIAANRDVVGFAPLPNAPFWNIESWVVVR